MSANLNKEEASERQNRKTRSVTFRIDSTVIDELQAESDNREISLNVLVNQVLKRYAEWDRYENKIGMMPVPKVMLSTLIDRAIATAKAGGIKDMERYRSEILKQAAKIEFDLMKYSVLFMKKQYNLWVVLSVLHVEIAPAYAIAGLPFALLSFNRKIPLAKFALGDDDEVVLCAELPTESLDEPELTAAIDVLLDTLEKFGDYGQRG